MSKIDVEKTQNIFSSMERLAALCATPGIEKETISVANVEIRVLIEVLSEEVGKLKNTKIELLK